MNKILLASHGYLAQGMKSSLEILMGTNDRIECLAPMSMTIQGTSRR